MNRQEKVKEEKHFPSKKVSEERAEHSRPSI
jgi:hypothetical protein